MVKGGERTRLGGRDVRLRRTCSTPTPLKGGPLSGGGPIRRLSLQPCDLLRVEEAVQIHEAHKPKGL